MTNLIFDFSNFAFKAISVYKPQSGFRKLDDLRTERIPFLKILTINFIAEYNRFKINIKSSPNFKYIN